MSHAERVAQGRGWGFVRRDLSHLPVSEQFESSRLCLFVIQVFEVTERPLKQVSARMRHVDYVRVNKLLDVAEKRDARRPSAGGVSEMGNNCKKELAMNTVCLVLLAFFCDFCTIWLSHRDVPPGQRRRGWLRTLLYLWMVSAKIELSLRLHEELYHKAPRQSNYTMAAGFVVF